MLAFIFDSVNTNDLLGLFEVLHKEFTLFLEQTRVNQDLLPAEFDFVETISIHTNRYLRDKSRGIHGEFHE